MGRIDQHERPAALRRTAGLRGPRRSAPTVVVTLVAINTAIELCLLASDAGWGLGPGWRYLAFHLGAFDPSLLSGGRPVFPGQQLSMFATYAFLHGGLLHLALNMLALYLFGSVIADRIGTGRFLAVYSAAAIGGALAFALLGDGITPMVGASGALFGLLGVWCCWDFLDKRHYQAPLWEIVRPLLFLLLYNLAFMVLLQGQIAWEAHLGGFVIGWCLALLWGRPIYHRIHTRVPASRKRP